MEATYQKKGKIYQTNSNGIETGNYNRDYFRICCQKDSQIHKMTKDILAWVDNNPRYDYGQLHVNTRFEDWVREEI